MPSLIQIVEIETDSPDVVRRLQYQWEHETGNHRVDRRLTFCADRERANTYLAVAEFDSYESALVHAGLPETIDFLRQVAAVCDKEPVIRDFTVISTSINAGDIRVA